MAPFAKIGRRDGDELAHVLGDLRAISDRLAYSTVGSSAARDERLLEALALLDDAMRSFVGLTGLWNRLIGNAGVARAVEETFVNPLAGSRLTAVGEALAVAPVTPAESATRLHEMVVLLARALRSRSRRRQGPLNAHDIRIGYAGLSLAATEAYEQYRESLDQGPGTDAERDSRRRGARRLLAALTVGLTVLAVVSRRVDAGELARGVREVWPEITSEEFTGMTPSRAGEVVQPVLPADSPESADVPSGTDAPGESVDPGAASGDAGEAPAPDDASDVTPPAGLRLINPR